jgi:V8-like Glu-specific endopeptidase
MTRLGWTSPRGMNWQRKLVLLTSVAAVVAMVGWVLPQPAAARTIAGTHEPAAFSTPQDYKGGNGSDPELRWSYILHHPGATYIALHFADFDLSDGDYLVITDENRAQAYALDGLGKMNARTFWAQHIKGDTAVLELYVVNPEGGNGFVVDEYVAGFLDLSAPPGEPSRAICGADDKEPAKCYETSHPTEYQNGRAVARLLSGGSGFCTGWLASAEGMLITNEHCITSQSEATNTDYEFMAEASSCSGGAPIQSAIFSGGTLIQDNAGLDFALIQVNGNPAQQFGYLEIDDRVATIGEEIYIIGHPGGRLKEFTIYSTHPSDPGVGIVQSITAPPCSGSGYNDVGYYADTEGGSSGSPVLARNSHKVIALHHCANCLNRGVPIHLVYAQIGQFLTPGPTGTVELDKDEYGCTDLVSVEMRDGDLLGTGAANVTLTTSGGDSENLLVSEAPASSAIFLGAMTTSGDAVVANDGTLQVADSDIITVTYLDADNGQGGLNVSVTDTATVDCLPPSITWVQTTDVQPRSATVTVTADEPIRVTVNFNTTCGGGLGVASSSGYSNPAVVELTGLQDDETYYYSVIVRDEGNNTVTDDNGGACYSFTTPEVPDFFTEEFTDGFDLEHMSLTFTPNGSVDYYMACVEPAAVLPIDPTGGTPISMSDDDSELISLLSGQTVSLYGTSYSSFYVGSNGFLTFTGPDTDYNESISEHFEQPRIAALYDDLNPANGGTITWQALADRVVVSFVGVPEYNNTGANTFQYELFDDGRIRISYGSLTADDGIVGLSAGAGLSPDFLEQDLSALGTCQATPPTASNGLLTVGVGQTQAVQLIAVDDGLPNPPGALTFTIESLPAYGKLHEPAGADIVAVPHTLSSNVVEYEANLYYGGPDSFSFAASDGGVAPDGGTSNVATIAVTVTSGAAPKHVFSFDSDPGWTTEGDWAYGTPLGGGSHNADPTSGATGDNVYGYNLAGDYLNFSPAYHLTTTPLNCQNLQDVELRFMRWLGVEEHDEASISVSSDGATWSQVWSHDGVSMADPSWVPMTVDISAVADGQPTVYVRWTMGATDDTVTYPGWNIDDVEIWGRGTVICAGDADCDGDVDFDDIGYFVAALGDDGTAWSARYVSNNGVTPPCLFSNNDMDADGDVDFDDIAPFVNAIGSGCN